MSAVRPVLKHPTPRLPIDFIGARTGAALAACGIAAVALADWATGYSFRLSVLYLAPIVVAAWTAGFPVGIAAAFVSCLLWLFSFLGEHFYRHPAFYLWEALAMLGSFLVSAWLSARLRQALHDADERFALALDGMPSAIYVADERADRIVHANPHLIEIAGDPGERSVATFERRWVSVPDGSRTLRDVVSGRWYLAQEVSIPWGGNPSVKLKVLTDITDQKNGERLREKNLEVMHHAAHLMVLAETASTLAHEVNQPLMVIATYTDACQRLLAAERPDHGEIASVLGKCHGQAVRAASIIERLREFIRRRQHLPAPADAREVVAEAVELARPMFEEAGVRVSMPSGGPSVIVDVDRVLLVQVLNNLFRNAVDAVRDLEPTRRRVEIELSRPSAEEVVIEVADHGQGIPETERSAIFTPFFTTKANGLGLGLAICRSVADAHGGRLWARDNQHGGASFLLALPAQPT